MRIHPILNWTYTDIWDYLRLHEVPWCHLYDEGCVLLGLARAFPRWTCVLTFCLPDAMARFARFTSLGSQLNTNPNPALALPPPAPEGSFAPAWKLQDESLERAGRGDPPSKGVVAEGEESALEKDDTGTQGR